MQMNVFSTMKRSPSGSRSYSELALWDCGSPEDSSRRYRSFARSWKRRILTKIFATFPTLAEINFAGDLGGDFGGDFEGEEGGEERGEGFEGLGDLEEEPDGPADPEDERIRDISMVDGAFEGLNGKRKNIKGSKN